MEDQYFTPEGLEKLKKELIERTGTRRAEIAKRIKEAKEEGDISENAGFDAAKEDQAANEGRIEEINQILENAKIFKGSSGKNTIEVGSSVTVESKDGATHVYAIVGAAESDPAKGFISNESPLGKSFLGRKKGDKIEVKAPKKVIEYKIIDVK